MVEESGLMCIALAKIYFFLVPPIEAQAKSNGGLERIAKALVLNSFLLRLSMLILPIWSDLLPTSKSFWE